MASTRSKTSIKRQRPDSESSERNTKKRFAIFEPKKSASSEDFKDIFSYMEGKRPEWDHSVKELWVEALRTPPLAFIDDIINAINDKMYNMLSALQQGFEKLLPDPNIVAEKMVQIDVLLESAVDRNYDVFELYALRNIFGFLPKDPVPPLHYEGFDLLQTFDIDELENELKSEREKLIGAEYFSYKALLFRNNTSKINEEIDRLNTEVNNLSNIMKDDSRVPSTSELSVSLVKFQEIMSKYKETLAVFKDPVTTRPTQRDMFLKMSILNHISKLMSEYDPSSDSTFLINKQYEKIKGQSWDEMLSVLEF